MPPAEPQHALGGGRHYYICAWCDTLRDRASGRLLSEVLRRSGLADVKVDALMRRIRDRPPLSQSHSICPSCKEKMEAELDAFALPPERP